MEGQGRAGLHVPRAGPDIERITGLTIVTCDHQ